METFGLEKYKKRNRHRIEIASDILKVCKREARTSGIIRGAKLSYTLFERYVGLLLSVGLLHKE